MACVRERRATVKFQQWTNNFYEQEIKRSLTAVFSELLTNVTQHCQGKKYSGNQVIIC